jgi:hypothetical protein
LVLYPAQLWKCMTWKLTPAGESFFHFQNHFTSKTLASKGDQPEPAVLQTAVSPTKENRPAWRLTKLADGLYQIKEVKSGKALTAVDSGGGNTVVVVAPWQDKAEQKWELIKTDPSKLTM